MNKVKDELLSLSELNLHSGVSFTMYGDQRVVAILPSVANDLLSIEPGLPATGLLPLETLDPISNAIKCACPVSVSYYVKRLVAILMEHVLHDTRALLRI